MINVERNSNTGMLQGARERSASARGVSVAKVLTGPAQFRCPSSRKCLKFAGGTSAAPRTCIRLPGPTLGSVYLKIPQVFVRIYNMCSPQMLALLRVVLSTSDLF